LDKGDVYYCKLLFFSDRKLDAFLTKAGILKPETSTLAPSFTIENDAYIHAYLDSLSTIVNGSSALTEKLLAIKFEELLVYLVGKYGRSFEIYLHSLVAQEASGFRSVIENCINSNLSLEDVAFLCHMSLSTFKRKFLREYQISPGKWFRERRLQSAYDTLKEGKLTSSDIYLKFGYNNLSNFSAAFKKKFGKYPTEIC
jgi:AraC-like DNA-binding protein